MEQPTTNNYCNVKHNEFSRVVQPRNFTSILCGLTKILVAQITVLFILNECKHPFDHVCLHA